MDAKRTGTLVGIDGSEQSLRALDWAVLDARGRGTGLTVCYVAEFAAVADVPLPAQVRRDADRYGHEIIDRAVLRVRAASGATPVHGIVAAGWPAAELMRLAAGAEQVILGSRGSGGFEQLLLGSVGAQLAAHAPCPVVVMRGADRSPSGAGGTVLIGVDGSEHGEHALEYGFGYAGRHGAAVRAVHTYSSLLMAPIPLGAWVAPDDLRGTAERVLRQHVDPWSAKHPEVPLTSTVLPESAAYALARESAGSLLVVVGSRGHGGFAGLLLGSVSQALLRHAQCPVAIAR